MTTFNYSLFYQDSILQRQRENGWVPANLKSHVFVFYVLPTHTMQHRIQGGINSAQKIRGVRYQDHWFGETNKTRKLNNLWEEYDYSHWWNRARSCHLCVSRTTAFRSEKKNTNSLRKFYEKNYENIYECNHIWTDIDMLIHIIAKVLPSKSHNTLLLLFSKLQERTLVLFLSV